MFEGWKLWSEGIKRFLILVCHPSLTDRQFYVSVLVQTGKLEARDETMTSSLLNYAPLIRPGDQMSLEEFLERWEQMPDLKFAELIEGTVYMPSAVFLAHMRLDSRMQGLCSVYCMKTLGTESGTNGTWLMTGSAPQPDCAIRILPEFGGHTTVKGGLVSGPPEFVVEICHSSRAYDLGPKLSLYQTAGVPEYLAILVEEGRSEWRMLVNGSYQLMTPDAGVYRSKVFPGFWFNSTAFWNEDAAALLQTLEAGLASQEHQDFVARLAQVKL